MTLFFKVSRFTGDVPQGPEVPQPYARGTSSAPDEVSPTSSGADEADEDLSVGSAVSGHVFQSVKR